MPAPAVPAPRPDPAGADRDWKFIGKLLADGMQDIAARQLQAFAASYPDDPRAADALLQAGGAFDALGNAAGALESYDRLLERFPSSAAAPAALLRRADLLTAQQRWGEAASTYETLLSSYTASDQSDRARLGLAEALLALQQRAEAARLFRFLIGGRADPPIAARAMFGLGMLHQQAGEDSLAVAQFDAISARYPAEPAGALGLLRAAELSAAGESPAASRERYQRVLTQYTDPFVRGRAHLGLGRLDEDARKYADAAAHYREAASGGGTPEQTQEGLLGLALCDMRAGRWDDAGAAARALLQKAPPAAQAERARLVLAQVAAGDAPRAAQDSLQTLADKAGPPVAYEACSILAGLREQEGNLEGAVTAWQEAQRHAPQPADKAHALMEAARITGDLLGRRALAADLCLAAAATDAPAALQAEALLRGMDHLARKGDDRAALAVGGRLLQEHPVSSQAAEARALVRRLQRRLAKDPETAARELAALTSRTDLDPAAMALTAGALVRDRLGDPQAALERFASAARAAANPEQRAQAQVESGLAYEALAVDAALRQEMAAMRQQLAAARAAYADAAQRTDAPRQRSRAQLALLRLDLARAALPDTPALFDSQDSPLLGGVGPLEELDLNARALGDLATRMAAALESTTERDDRAWLLWRLSELASSEPVQARIARAQAALKLAPSPTRELALRYTLGQLLLQAEDGAGAAEQLRQVLERAGSEEVAVAARYALAEVHRAAKRYAQAEELYLTYAGAYPDSQRGQRALLLAGDCALFSGDAQKAADHYQQLLERYPDGVYTDDASYRLGTTLARLGTNEAALVRFHSLAEGPAGSRYVGRSLLKIAGLEESGGRPAAARDALVRLVDVDAQLATESDAALRIAELELTLGRPREALVWVDRAAPAAATPSGKAVALRARARAAAGDVAGARADLQRLSDGYPDAGDLLTRARLDYADALAGQGQGQDAQQQYQAAGLAAGSADLRARAAYAQGLLLAKGGKLQDALPEFREAVRRDPGGEWAAQALFKVGVISADAGDHAQAKDAFARLAEGHPDHALAPEAMRGEATALRQLGQFEQALAVYHALLERYPDYPQAQDVLVQIAYCHHEMGQYEIALGAYQKVLPLLDEEGQAFAQFWIADSLQQLGRLEESAAGFLKIPYLYASMTELAVTAQLRAGDVYERMGRADAARSLYEKVLQAQGAQSQWGSEAKKRLDHLAGSRAARS